VIHPVLDGGGVGGVPVQQNLLLPFVDLFADPDYSVLFIDQLNCFGTIFNAEVGAIDQLSFAQDKVFN
jgi:hypothetical protein